jgi:Uma2 family endonuclease
VYNAELQVRAFREPSLVRKPDAAFVQASRVPVADRGYLELAPDAVVEVVSPNDGAQEVRDKVEQWLSAGVRLVWVAYPSVREIIAYRPGQRPNVFTAADEITGEDVIPGFRTAVADFFPKPSSVTA